MQKTNMMIIGVAAVVIVVCAAATYLVYGDDDDGQRTYEMRDPQVGDYYSYLVEATDENGSTFNYTYTAMLEAVLDDGSQIMITFTDRGEALRSTTDSIWNLDALDHMVGQETVYSPLYGTVVCDVYQVENEDADEFYVMCLEGTETYVMQRQVIDGTTTDAILQWTSTFEEYAIDYGSSVESDTVEAGDFYSYVVTSVTPGGTISEMTAMINRVVSTDEDGITIGYTDRDGGYHEEESTVDGFLDHLIYGYQESFGTALYYSEYYGPRLCDVYFEEVDGVTVTNYVGHDDGVLYFSHVIYDDGSNANCELAYSSLVTGDGYLGTGETRHDPVLGDCLTYMTVWEHDGQIVDAYYQYQTVNKDIDGVQTVDLFINNVYTESWEDLVIWSDDDEMTDATEVLSTPYGDIACYIDTGYGFTDGVAYTCTEWIAEPDGYDFVMKSVYVYEDGYTCTDYLVINTLFEEYPVFFNSIIDTGAVDTGDEYIYIGMYNGQFSTMTATVTSVDEEATVDVSVIVGAAEDMSETMSLEQFLYVSKTNRELIGGCIMNTSFYIMALDVYSYEQDDLRILEYASDDVVIAIELFSGEDLVGRYMLYNGSSLY